MAMEIGSQYDPDALLLRHWEQLVAETQAAKNNLRKMMLGLIEKIEPASQQLQKTLADNDIQSAVTGKICKIIINSRVAK